MKNYLYTFWGTYVDSKKETTYIAYTLLETKQRNRTGIFIGIIAFLLIGFSDFSRIGYTMNSYITVGIRILFFILGSYICFSWRKRTSIQHIYLISFIFAFSLCNLITLIIFLLNTSSTIHTIDLLTVPLTFIILYVFLIIPTHLLLANGIITSTIYLLTISKYENIDIVSIFTLGTILLTLNIMGFYITRYFSIVRRNEFLQIRKIQELNKGLHEEIEERKSIQEELAKAYSEITESMRYASHFQVSMLSETDICKSYMQEYFVMYKPCGIVSGDFYWIESVDNKLIVATADCTGHGIRSAFMSVIGISILNDIVKNKGIIHADLILNAMREEFIRLLKQTGNQDSYHDGLDITLCVIDPKEMILEYAGAYNPLLQIHNSELIEYKADRMPISYYMAAKPSFRNNIIKLEKGDIFYMFTDGYSDQFGGELNKKFTYKRLKRELLTHAHLPLEEQFNFIEYMHNQWKGIEAQTDDIVFIGFKI